MQRYVKLAGMAVLAFLFIASSPLAFASRPAGTNFDSASTNQQNPSNPPGHTKHNVPQTFTLTISVQGSWHQDPSYHCPGQCQANDRFYGSGTLTYSNSTSTFSIAVEVNGTAHSNWTGVNMNNPCTTITSNVDFTTANHDRIHMQMTGSDCKTYVNGQYTGRNVISGEYTVMSGEGLFSEASGSGTVSVYGYPGAHAWFASANGDITFVPKPNA